MKQLWEDQIRIVSELSDYINSGRNNALVFSPTGSGKTTIAAHSIINVFPNSKHLFLVNRDALIMNTYEEFQEYNQECGVFAANYPELLDVSQRIQIASIQTIDSRGLSFFENSSSYTGVPFVWFDEAHLTAFTQFGSDLLANPNFKKIGLTGTPERTSPKEELGDKFDYLVKGAMPWQLISQGRLKKPIYYNLNKQYNLKSDEAISFAIREWKRLAKGKKTILFAADVDHAHSLAEAFNSAGIPFNSLDAKTPIKQRQEMFDRLKNGEITGLASYDALSEGFNIKSISCVMLFRDTDSRSKYYQQIGRGLRYFPGLDVCHILDFPGLSSDEKFGCIEDIIDVSLSRSGSSFDIHREIPKKSCPNCSSRLPSFHMKCPQCGYKFPAKSLPSLSLEAQLLQQLSLRERGMLLTYRQKLREAYASERSLVKVEQEFESRFDQKPLPDWANGAIFNSKGTIKDQAKYLKYLQKVAANEGKTQRWVTEQLAKEFFPTFKK